MKRVLHQRVKERDLMQRRIRVAMALFLVGIVVVAGRFVFLQVLAHDEFVLRSEANRQQLRPVAPARGLIYDRNGELLAENKPAFRLEIVPEQVEDMDALLEDLRQLLAISSEEIDDFRELRASRRSFDAIPLRFRLTEIELARLAVNRHRLNGVEVSPYLMRHYPAGPVMSHVVGYVGKLSASDLQSVNKARYAATGQIGKTGVEAAYENVLHGHPGLERVETNAQGRRISDISREPARAGEDITLAIDAQLMRDAAAAMGGRTGAIVAIDPRNGEVLAMVSEPGFDANLFVDGISSADYRQLLDDPMRPLFNRALRGRYEPGSTVKPFLALGGLSNRVISPDHTVDSRGYFTLPGVSRRYRDWRRGGHGVVDVVEAIEQSVNVFFYELAVDMGIDMMSDWMAQFGFGEKTGVDLPGELAGILPSRGWKRAIHNEPWYQGETVITGIGQGFSLATPVQLATATAQLANGGVPLHPHVVSAPDRVRQKAEPAGSVVSSPPQYWDLVHEGMEEVLHGARGTARAVGRELDFRMAGKSGTAQVFNRDPAAEEREQEELPLRLRNHAWFIAYAPATDPVIAVAVIVEHGGSGSMTAAPIAGEVVQAWMARQQVSE